MTTRPLAYHITFGTYGTRLHGDARGTVDRGMNKPGDPIIGADRGWWEFERGKLKFPPVELDREKMLFVESVLPSICARGGWEYHTGVGGADHVHTLSSPKFGTVTRPGVGTGWPGNHCDEAWALLIPGSSRIREPVRPPRVVDIAATVCELAGADASGLPGQPLLERVP